ncbi:MAG: hypothetical protein ACRCZI_10395 [Cetobacterium sp.]
MAASIVTLRPSISPGMVTGRYVCDAAPTLTNINIGFVPSFVEVWNITDGDTYSFWSEDMAANTCISITTAAATVGSGSIAPVAHTDGTNLGFSVGTNVAVQEALKTWGFRATR